MRRLVATLILCAAAVVAHAIEVQVTDDQISGRVYESSSNRGIQGLSVRLVAPRLMKLPVRITLSDANGEFAFTGLEEGKYLLEIYQGTALLYRKEIDNRVAQRFAVTLRAVPRR